MNRVILTGRLAADPEIRYTKTEKAVAHFSLAVARQFKKGENSADFIKCIAWEGLAKVCGEYLKKGRLVAIEGKLQISSYQDKKGQKRTMTEVIVDNMQMLDNKFFKAANKEEEKELVEV